MNRMSHDIRTPINGIMGMLEIIRKNRSDEKKVDDCLNKIHLSSSHLLALINDVLDMSKLEQDMKIWNRYHLTWRNLCQKSLPLWMPR